MFIEFGAPGAPTDLVTLTRLVHGLIVEDVATCIAATIDPARTDCAVATGILVHGPQGRDHIWPGEVYVILGGVRQDLALG